MFKEDITETKPASSSSSSSSVADLRVVGWGGAIGTDADLAKNERRGSDARGPSVVRWNGGNWVAMWRHGICHAWSSRLEIVSRGGSGARGFGEMIVK